tara:strand:- start:363 stop:1145 length:783 start_codon:yes stop_codon:yes gene_type:complete
MKNILLGSFIIFSVTFCKSKKESKQTEKAISTPQIQLVKAPPSPSYLDSELNLVNIDFTATDTSYLANFDFDVKNYELGVITSDANERGIANSAKGQHIHLILDNKPYSAHYDPIAQKNLPKGQYVALAFLSRSYHESIKNENSFVLTTFNAGSSKVFPYKFDEKGKHMFYSRPKGTYKGSDINNLLLDFFLINVTISPDGNKVRATINSEIFIIDEWVPYYIQGLKPGIITIKLELLNADGTVIEGPFNEVTRTVTLLE